MDGAGLDLGDPQGQPAGCRQRLQVAAGPLFTRPKPRATFADLVCGLLGEVARKNSWQLAEHAGHGTARPIEHLLDGAKWDADALRIAFGT